MEPSPPRSDGTNSLLRFHPRGQQQRRRANVKISPRHVRLQSVPCALPLYVTAALQDQLHGQFRHELFSLHQQLHDAAASCCVGQHWSTAETQLAQETQRSSVAFEALTSDHRAAVMREFFRQWERTRENSGQTSPSTEEELLNQLVDTIFRNMPVILTESDVRNAKSFVRYVEVLRSMREVVLSLLYKSRENPGAYDGDENNRARDPSTPPAPFASTAALLDAFGGPRPVIPASSMISCVKTKRVPLYLYCQQLERENDSLKRRLRNVRRNSHVDGDDVGLLNEQTLALLVKFWELPRLERLAFFCQIASQAKREDCDSVLRVFHDKCSTDNLLSMWDALQLTPHLQHALATRKHGDDAEAAAREAAEALATATQDVEERHQKARSDSDSRNSDGSSEGENRRRVRRAESHHLSQRQVDLSGLTNGFEDDDDVGLEDSEETGGDGWNSTGGKRRRRRLRVRDRGRTPEGSHPHSRHKDKHHGRQKGANDHSSDCSSSMNRPPSNPATPQLILDRVHSSLLELLKAEDLDLAPTIIDVAWKLVEVIDRTRRHDSIVPRGPQRKLSTLQQHHGVPPPVVDGALLKHGATVPATHAPRQFAQDAFGTNLTTEQQYLMRIDQLQAHLATLGGFSLQWMSTEAITSAFKRMPALRRLFQAVESKALEAVGIDSSIGQPTHPILPAAPQSAAAVIDIALDMPIWGDDQVMSSVEIMLGKLGKMVRSLAPIAVVGSVTSVDGHTAASAEIIKLAEAMEDVGTIKGDKETCPGRRHLSLDPSKRMAMLNRLKSLAQSNQIESLTTMLVTRCEDIAALNCVSDHQRQLQLFTASALEESVSFSEDEGGTAVDRNGASVGAGEADEVLKLVKKAKIRRASAAKLAAASVGTSKGDTNEAEEDDQVLLMNPMTAPRYANRLDIPLTIKQATAQRGSKLLNAGILLRVVDQMYRENYEAMVSSLQYGSRRMEFSEFMYDWHIRKYGLKSLAQQHLLKLIQSLRKYERKVFQCQLCLRFLGVVSPLGFHEHKFVLGLLDKWSAGTFSGASKHRVEFIPRQFKVRIPFAISTVQEALSERFGVYFRTIDAVASRIKAQAMLQDEEFIKEADLLAIAIDEWQSQRQRIEQILEAVYAAGDLNGDGSLEYDEFYGVMVHLSPSLQEKFIQKVFTAAHDYLTPRRISFDRFLDVVLLERVLNTTTPAGKAKQQANDRSSALASTSAASTFISSPALGAARATAEEEEMYQFNLLQETWEHDKEIVAQALSSVTHQATAAAIQFRVTFLTQILSRRVDSKTAWMCHRQIMREIRRYQNLNDDQVVAIKTKEETFRKAVVAIRNLQRLSLAFKRPAMATVESPPVSDDSASQDQASCLFERSPHELNKQISYVGVVEGALASAETASLAEIEALEDQLREKFLERADEGAIDDFKSALQTIRRMSVQAFPSELELEQVRGRTPLPFDCVEEEDGDDEAEEEEEEDEAESAEEVEDGEV